MAVSSVPDQITGHLTGIKHLLYLPVYCDHIATRIRPMQKTSDIIWQDTQHQVLFELIEKIKVVPFDPDILVRLKLYAEHHFILEETYMIALDYPHRDAHVEAHDRFREELEAMLDTDPTMHESLQISLSDFLYKWLKLHVLGIDKKLEDFVMKSDSK
jgi:hemerythrin